MESERRGGKVYIPSGKAGALFARDLPLSTTMPVNRAIKMYSNTAGRYRMREEVLSV